ncbi:M3 family metallopeptidase [Nigerium massiliense]|uniref:M3 family metallopeptidase n=1 Tax=Nigerium massiliense TaxID=1522317 RepID=UPI0006934873|nr:M3 family metallopeptidase [Nigerium massiliense]
MTSLDPSNPFAAPSTLDYKLPDFAAIKPEHYRAAIDAGMAESLAELDALASEVEPATAENVLDAWERSGALLDRTLTAFYTVKACDTNDELDAIQADYAPVLSEYSDKIYMDRRLYDRFAELAGRVDAGDVELDPQASWLLTELMRSFVRAGVTLGEEDQQKLRDLNGKLAELGTRFEKANLAARNAAAVQVSDEAELDGLSDEEKQSLRNDDGTWTIAQVNTSQHPLLAKLTNRGLRRRVYEASVSRGLSGDADTRQIIVDIARLRAERANLLGYPNHAAFVTERFCAKNTDNVNEMLGKLGPAALAQAQRDAVDLEARLQQIEPGASLEPWDWSFVAELVRKERYDLDLDGLRPYLGVQKVLDAVYGAATKLYGITFTERPDLRGHTEDAVVYEVADADGTKLGLFIMDFWARPSKQGGAWMNSIVNQSHLLGDLPVVTNNCNYSQGTTTISWDGVITMFHEFGHALHGLFSDGRYPSTSGTSTPRDFVEFPSQVNEHWAWEPDAVIPADWAAKMTEAGRFNQGFGSFETLCAQMLDQAWHQADLDALPTSGDQVEQFEREALERVGMNYDLIPPRYRTQYFSHIWGSGYSGAYYSYVWAEVMDADAVAWFTENGGGTRENGDYFRRTLLAPGGSVDVMDTWRNFRGRDPEIGPLLERKGLQV